MLSRLRSHAPAWRRALRRRRRLLLVLTLTALVAALLPTVMPPSARGVEVVVADVPLAAGTVLEPSHLRTARIAAELVPAGSALDLEHVVGRTTLVPLAAGAPLVPGMLEGAAARIPEGAAAMVVPAPAALVPHLSPGAAVELHLGDPAGGAGTSIAAKVLEVSASGSSVPALGGGAPTVEVLVVVDREVTREVAHALRGGSIVLGVIG